MVLPAGMYTLRPETKAHLRGVLPFPAELLSDRDDLGRGLTLVEDGGTERWFRFNTGAMLKVTVRGENLVDVAFFEGEDGARTFIERGMRLPLEHARAIRAALVPGAEVDPALRSIWGARLRLLTPMLDTTAGARRTRRWRVDHEYPYRIAVLEVVDVSGRVVDARVLEGRPAWDLMMAGRA